jgi:hypothetical protein
VNESGGQSGSGVRGGVGFAHLCLVLGLGPGPLGAGCIGRPVASSSRGCRRQLPEAGGRASEALQHGCWSATGGDHISLPMYLPASLVTAVANVATPGNTVLQHAGAGWPN